MDSDLLCFLTSDELKKLHEAQESIDDYNVEMGKLLEKYRKIDDELNKIAKKAEEPYARRDLLLIELGLLDLDHCFVKSFKPKEPERAYAIVDELRQKAEKRKTRQEQEELKRLQAESEAEEYAKQLWNSITSFQTSLLSKKKNLQSYFDKDPRYLGYTFLPPDEKKGDCERVVEESIKASIPESLCPFLSWKYRLSYRLLPSVQYSLIDDVPCLEFGFDIAVVVEIEYWVKPAQVTIGGYCFTMPVIEYPVNMKVDGEVIHQGSYTTALRNPEFLGYAYKQITPDNLGAAGYLRWQAIPCIIIQGLIQGDVEPQGTKIIEASGNSTKYEINGFDEEISIPDTFSKYLKAIGSWQGLTEKGVISLKVGEIVGKAMERSAKELPSPEMPKLTAGNYEEIVEGLRSLGWKKTEAEEKAKYVMEKYPDASLEEQIRHALAN